MKWMYITCYIVKNTIKLRRSMSWLYYFNNHDWRGVTFKKK